MADRGKTKEQLIEELAILSQRVAELEAAEVRHRQAEEMLREREQQLCVIAGSMRDAETQIHRLAQLVDASPASITVHDLDGHFLYASQRTFDLHGYTRDEFMALNLHQIDVPESEQLIIPRIQTLLTRGEISFEVSHYRKDGTILPLFVEAQLGQWGDQQAILSIATDMTERKQMEDALARERILLRTVIDYLPDAIYVKDAATSKVLVNRADLDNIGKPEAEVLGKTDKEVFPPDVAARFYADDMTVLQAGRPVLNREELLVNVHGQRRWLSTSKLPLRDEGGQSIGLIGIGHDITERKQAEEMMYIQRDLGVSLGSAKTMPEALSQVLDAALRFGEVDCGGVYLVNRRTGGLDLAVHRGLVPRSVERISHYDCDNPLARIVMAGEPRYVSRAEVPSLTGEICEDEGVCAVALVPVCHQGEVVAALSLASRTCDQLSAYVCRGLEAIAAQTGEVLARIEIEAALYQSEERYRSLVENIPIGVYRNTPGPTGRFLTVNPAFRKMFGFAPTEGLEDVAVSDLYLHPEGRQLFSDRLISEGTLNGAEFELKKRDGTPLWGRVTARVIYSPDRSEALYFDCAIEDITERKQAEEEREKLRAQFLQAQKMEAVGQLAGGVAHDFNNHLTAILGYADLLLETLEKEDSRRADVEEIKKAATRSASLTRQLLAFSRKQIIQPIVLNLNTIIVDMEKMLRRLIGEHITLVPVLAPGLGQVRADPGQIEQVIVNLSVNARDAMPHGGTLIIETANAELDETYANQHMEVTPGPYVLLAVSDTGLGMDLDTQAHLFEPFFTTKEKGKGTGLGLATVYGIVKQSGGHIWIYSEPGQGTTLKVYLPRVDHAAVLESDEQVEAVSTCGAETILLTEDEDAVRLIACRALQRHGYVVLEAHNADEALAVSKQHPGPIHLLLTDVVLPGGKSGRTLAESLLPARPGTKVLYMSGYTDNAIVHHGVLEAGVHLIQKPFSAESLAHKVRQALDGRQ